MAKPDPVAPKLDITNLTEKIRSIDTVQYWSRSTAVTADRIQVAVGKKEIGLGNLAFLMECPDIGPLGEVIAVDRHEITILRYSDHSIKVGEKIIFDRMDFLFPQERWYGTIRDAFGRSRDPGALGNGLVPASIHENPPSATLRRSIGDRLHTPLKIFNTFLPLCRGQRIGLFAAAGVGKTSLLEQFARQSESDVTIIALIGERGHEVSGLGHRLFGEAPDKRLIIFAATSDEAAPIKRRAAYSAMACAEHFRRKGKQVLLLFDSLTRFADAHREIALCAGETAALRGYPPSLTRTIAGLLERAGPGSGNEGDITAVFTVLVAGNDHDEPVADISRGILDGHIILSRRIAERGRFPAIDLLRSVSRALPRAATPDQNRLLNAGRQLISTYEDAEPMIRAGLYEDGSDKLTDEAMRLWPLLDQLIAEETTGSIDGDFAALAEALA